MKFTGWNIFYDFTIGCCKQRSHCYTPNVLQIRVTIIAVTDMYAAGTPILASLFSVFFVIFFTFCNTYFFDCFHAIAFTFLFMFAHSNHFFFALAGLINTKYPIIPIAANIIPKCIETPNIALRKLKHL